ncbi:MAG TPA: rhodanese-like domain-containing protein [Bacillota bacterium]|nr:rhodanese-like domain-containing protein [Bacillota bacterium]
MRVQDVTSDVVQQLIKEDKDLVLVDVREQEELEQGMIENARHIPLGDIPHVLNELSQSKHYVMICRSGRRSMIAALFLDEKGYKASNLKGGMLEWNGEIFFK